MYPEILKIYRGMWESDSKFKEDTEKNLIVMAGQGENFTIPILNGNRAKNLGADCIAISLPKQNLTKAQKISYQERFVEAVKKAQRWEELIKKTIKRQEEDQRK